jgi:hypothetical protein
VRAELQNEITELSGSLKLRAFEVERSALLHEEVSNARVQLETENEQLKQKLDLVRKEYYTLEVQHREGRAADRAELSSLKGQLGAYVEIERELDAAIRASAEGPTIGGSASAQSIDEALLLGTTLASAPSSAQRRIQQSLILAQEVQRRTLELGKLRAAYQEREVEIERLRQDLAVARKELEYSSEPQARILEVLRNREHELLDLKRKMKVQSSELEKSRQQMENAVAGKLQIEDDLKRLLAQREHLQGLRALIGGEEKPSAAAAESLAVAAASVRAEHRAEHRGRAPSQQQAAARQHQQQSPSTLAPTWLSKLRGNVSAASPANESPSESKLA